MRKILVVDDDLDLSELLKTFLIQNGYGVYVSHNAKSAIEIAKENKPDLILMDIMLPDSDGAETARTIKSTPLLRDIPIIFLTGLVSSDEENKEESHIVIEGKYYPTLAKPIDVKRLLIVIKQIFNKDVSSGR